MMIQAVLGNPHHPEYGVATIPFPIPRDQHAHCMELLEALEIGDAVKTDCKVEKIDSFYTVLKRAEMLTVNVEELNYLAKRLDSFDTGEAAQFQAMAHKLELFELKALINLTFCCQQATVITDFSDLAAVGRDHYMNLHGGSAGVDELNALDSEGTARQLIESGSGTITPYGVVYDNGMKLEQVYDGRLFPCYYYEPNVITVAVTSKAEPEDTEHITWLFLPMVQEEIDRALLRGGITDPADVRLRLEDSQLPNEVDVLLDMEYETLSDLNELAAATDGLSKADMDKKNYGKEGSEIIQDNCQDTIFGGFAPNSQTAEVLSKALGNRTVLSGSVSRGKNDPSQSLQMMERPLLTPDELKSIPKGNFIVQKTGQHPMRTRLRLFLEWGITFEEPYIVPQRADRAVAYANREDLERNLPQSNKAENADMRGAYAVSGRGGIAHEPAVEKHSRSFSLSCCASASSRTTLKSV